MEETNSKYTCCTQTLRRGKALTALKQNCYIYTSSVFCYDKHKKNLDIQFSMKRHETV